MSIVETLKSSNLENLEFMYKQFSGDLNNFNKIISDHQKRIEAATNELTILGEVKKLLIKLKNSKMIDKKDFILNTINTALSDVFLDQIVKIDIVAANTNQEASKLNIKYDVVLFQNGVEMARNEKLLNNNGGGVLSFISILFKILVGYIYSKNKFYIFDESVAEVSELYRPRMAQFFQKFCSVHGFTIVLITQTSDMAEYADLTYYLDGEFEDGIPTLKVDRIVGEDPKENYIFTEIENFQSIKKLKFKYKGYTAVIGKNNIGKSASFRAVNSLLFNAFDTKEYPRMLSSDKPEKRLNTRIVFGFVGPDGEVNDKVIEVYKKGVSLIYKFDGQEFVGKMMAFDKVKEKIESIGFRYLRLKDSYKNFKGSLKDQTERLAITTQQDDYYLIGGKAADTAKVFDFLFDSREVTLAIVDLNEDILKNEKIMNDSNLDIFVARNAIKGTELKLKLCSNIYQQKLIESYEKAITGDSYIVYCINLNQKFVSKINQMLDLIMAIDGINGYTYRIEQINNSMNITNKKLEIIDKLVNKESYLNDLRSYFSIIKTVNVLSVKLRLATNRLNGLFLAHYFYCSEQSNYSLSQLQILNKRNLVYENLINCLVKIDLLENMFIVNDNANYKIGILNKLSRKSSILGELINKGILKDSLQFILTNTTIQQDFINKAIKSINYNTKLLYLYGLRDRIDSINNYFFEQNKIIENIQNIQANRDKIKYRYDNLHLEFNLQPCNHCGGIGFCN